jgi:hypothetical protein
MRTVFLYIFFLACFANLSAQSVTPFTLNIAGFTATQNGFNLTVSTGETISITNFKSPNGESLNSGFLQNNPPLVTSIEELMAKIGSNEVSIAPNPTNSSSILSTNFSVLGQMQYQIMDITSKLLFRSQPQSGINIQQTKIELSSYPAGTYYIVVFFKPSSGMAKSGIYKIIKL